MDEVPKRKGRGRPPGRVYNSPTQIRLTTEQKAHLKRQYRTVTAGLRSLVEKSMMRESIPTYELTADDRAYLIKEYGSVATGIRKLIENDRAQL